MADSPRSQLTHKVPVRRPERLRVEAFDSAEWRLLPTATSDGPTNMAIDEAIAEAVADGASPPTLRFYGWEPPCLSLGFRQPWDDVDVARARALGWDVVRRPTGGRAILHTDELTYVVCAPDGEPRVKGGVLESYKRLSAALLNGLRALGVDADRATPYYHDHSTPGPACFDGPSDYEITVAQRKLIGSAQLRRRGVVLQHGTLPLVGDITRICDGLWFETEGQRMATRSRLRYRATTLESALGGPAPSLDAAAAALRDAFAETLALRLLPGTLTAAETARVAQLRAEKYAAPAWTERV